MFVGLLSRFDLKDKINLEVIDNAYECIFVISFLKWRSNKSFKYENKKYLLKKKKAMKKKQG